MQALLTRHAHLLQADGLPLPSAQRLLCRQFLGPCHIENSPPDSIVDLHLEFGPAKRPRVELDPSVMVSRTQLRAAVQQECSQARPCLVYEANLHSLLTVRDATGYICSNDMGIKIQPSAPEQSRAWLLCRLGDSTKLQAQ